MQTMCIFAKKMPKGVVLAKTKLKVKYSFEINVLQIHG
jgi:hypothetical protein